MGRKSARWLSLATAGFMALLATHLGCAPRAPGPHLSEIGAITYWRYLSVELQWGHLCTDEPGGIDAVEPPAIEENTYFPYLLMDGGKRAIVQNCDSSKPATCTDARSGIVLDVRGHELNWTGLPERLPLGAVGCEVQFTEHLHLTDGGEKAELRAGATLNLVGNSRICREVQIAMEAQAPNGQGLDGCTLDLIFDMEHARTQLP
jgi:hypothetical protein